MSEWLPIETAPKDGTRIDVWAQRMKPAPAQGRRVCEARYSDRDGWQDKSGRALAEFERGEPGIRLSEVHRLLATHWMPIPKPPV